MRGWLQAGRARGRQGEAFQGLQPPLSAGSLGQEPGVGRAGQCFLTALGSSQEGMDIPAPGTASREGQAATG